MMNLASPLGHSRPRTRNRLAVVLGVLVMVGGMPCWRSGDRTVLAQATEPCALLTTDEVQSLASKTTIKAGVSSSPQAGFGRCRFAWGEGTGRVILDVTVSDASRMFTGMGADSIKQAMQTSVRAETDDAVVSGVGETAVFRADSALYAYATAYVKGRIVQVSLDGFDARDKKDRIIELLTSAVERF